MKLFIPDKLKVGFQERDSTYTGKLAYVIYYDEKGKLRKESSWQSWRDKKIEPLEIENEPTEGFVLNKKVGGNTGGWNPRNTYVRVYDPRDFEFEISIPNLLFILKECDCSRGKGLEGKFVYSWDGTELVLLPVGSVDYSESKDYTNRQSGKISLKELVRGATYQTKEKDTKELVYIGRVPVYPEGKSQHVFCAPKGSRWLISALSCSGKWEFLALKGTKSLSACLSESPHVEFAEMADAFYKSKAGSPVKSLEIRSVSGEEGNGPWAVPGPLDGQFILWGEPNDYYYSPYEYGHTGPYRVEHGCVSLDGPRGIVSSRTNLCLVPEGQTLGDPPYRYSYRHRVKIISQEAWDKMRPGQALFAVLESGSVFKVNLYGGMIDNVDN